MGCILPQGWTWQIIWNMKLTNWNDCIQWMNSKNKCFDDKSYVQDEFDSWDEFDAWDEFDEYDEFKLYDE